MTAYVISRVSISDANAMSDYIDRAPPGVTARGGRYLVRAGDIDCLEGQTDYERIVVLAFPDKAKALAWYNLYCGSLTQALRGGGVPIDVRHGSPWKTGEVFSGSGCSTGIGPFGR